MNKEDILKEKKLKEAIKKLPRGYISTKNVNGNIYYYHQWSVDGKKYSKYLSSDELLSLKEHIRRRNELEQELKLLKKGYKLSDILYCTLMHKDVEVVDLELDINRANIVRVGKIYSVSHLPTGTLLKNEINQKALVEWWDNRSIPLSRTGARALLDNTNIINLQSLVLKCYGLSLSDQYWIKPHNMDLKWKDINFFDNDFSEDVGNLLFGYNHDSNDLNLSSPDNTSIGNLKKKWIINNSKRMLVKGGSNPFRQEPFNEVVAYKVAEALGISAIPYSLVYEDEYPYSICEDFINKNCDLVPIYQLNKVLVRNNNDSAYTHLVKCAYEVGIKDVEYYLDTLIVFDFLIANEDRHYNNFGFIKDVNTLEYIAPAPLFDNGSSFGFNKIVEDIKAYKNIESKPFNINPKEQLKLVRSFDWLDKKELDKTKEVVYSIFSQYESKYLTKERINAISEAYNERVEYIKSLF